MQETLEGYSKETDDTDMYLLRHRYKQARMVTSDTSISEISQETPFPTSGDMVYCISIGLKLVMHLSINYRSLQNYCFLSREL